MTRSHSAWWTAASLLLLTAIYLRLGKASSNVFVEGLRFEPKEVGLWKCETLPASRATYLDPNADDSWTGLCTNSRGLAVELFWGFSASQSKERSLLSPDERLSIQPHRVLSRQRIRVTSADAKIAPLNASLTLAEWPGGKKSAVLYWYQMKGRTYADRYHFRAALMVNKLLLKPTPTSVIRISAVGAKGSIDQVLMDEQNLASAIYSQVLSLVCLPVSQFRL
ncbi:MAG: EpsI family protein [Acidobacteria bacterium]|nr:EpsI family protein [Acidobacteriota bacterium]MCI0725006.1 EpsI family protein [Acidobacteriota bacterium]